MTNLDNILKSRDITLPRKVRLVKAMVFPVFYTSLRASLSGLVASSPITSWKIDGKTVETVSDFIFILNHCRW